MLPLITIARNWKLIAAGVAALALIGAGVWFRGVLAENKELTQVVNAQTETLKEVTAEVERMNKVQAADHALRENIEAQKVLLAQDLAANQRNLRKAKDLLDEASTRCLDLPLPQSYLDGLPQAEDPLRP